MRTIKKMKVSTLEGITFKDVQLFPSMEWGDEGGHSATILYKDQEVGSYFQQGNGGCADVHINITSEKTLAEFSEAVKNATYRLETVHYPELKLGLDDNIEILFDILLNKSDTLDFYKKTKKKHNISHLILAEIQTSWQTAYVCQNILYLKSKYKAENASESDIKSFMQKEISAKYTVGGKYNGENTIEKIDYFCSEDDFMKL